MTILPRAAATMGVLLLLSAAGAQPIKLTVDASDAPRRLFHSTLEIPAAPGPLTLVYPKWIPGEHAPTGPIAEVVGFHISASGKDLEWRRDLVETHALRTEVPLGEHAVTVTFDYLSPADTDGFTNSPSSTPRLAIVDWHLFLVYPMGRPASEIAFQASLKPPAGWKNGGSLAVSGEKGGVISYAPTSLEMLVDHPVVIGQYYRDVDLSPGQTPSHHLDVVADSEAALVLDDAGLEPYRRLVVEMGALFRARHYRDYHFLLTLSDHVASFGLEHHECSDNRLGADAWTNPDAFKQAGSLLTHEYFHSWNGKHRRPAGLATPDFHTPMKGDLLWVYEGLTEYYGDVLAARSGAWSAEDYREYLANVAAGLDHREGRTWRPLRDTADGASFLYSARPEWANHRRGVDFYDEGELIWLEADAIIRAKTGGAKSLDDFCRAFHAPGAGLAGADPKVVPYDAGDVYDALHGVASHDWKRFFESRLASKSPKAPMGGIEGAGWTLVYTDEPNWFEARAKGVNLLYSLGLQTDDAGKVTDVVVGMPAAKAGLAPGMKLLAINGRKFSRDTASAAVAASKGSASLMEVIAEDSDFYTVHRLDYHEGPRHPHLKRVEGSPDLLSAILAPLAAPR